MAPHTLYIKINIILNQGEWENNSRKSETEAEVLSVVEWSLRSFCRGVIHNMQTWKRQVSYDFHTHMVHLRFVCNFKKGR